MTTPVEGIIDVQYEALQQFKMIIGDVLPTKYPDSWLIKWLRSYNYNLEKAELFFRGAMRTRVVFEMDTIIEKYQKPEVAEKYEYIGFLGFDKKGSPIHYAHFGSGDHVGFILSMTSIGVAEYAAYVVEFGVTALRKENKRTGRHADDITYIIDVENIPLTQSLNKMAIEGVLDGFRMLQENYPEMLGHLFVVNVPSYFDVIFNYFKPLLRVNFLEKIRLASKESTPGMLLKYIDADVLPAFLGGKRVDISGDPRCTEFIKFGGKIPEKYYARNKPLLMPSDPGVTSTWIPARSVYNYPIVIRESHSKIRLELRSENGSIGLRLLYREFGDDADTLDLPRTDEILDETNPKCNFMIASPNVTAQTHLAPQNTILNAPWPGIYIIKFDNTGSWFTSRRIIFRVREVEKNI